MILAILLVCLSVLAPVYCSSCKPAVGCGGETLTVEYGDEIDCGSNLSPSEAASAPTVYYDQGSQGDQYLLLMVDPDAPSASAAPSCGYYLHWVQEVEKGDDDELENIGSALKSYVGPTPPSGTGPHRYQFLLFPLPEGGTNPSSVPSSRANFNLENFLAVNGLSFPSLLAKFEFKAEHGTK